MFHMSIYFVTAFLFCSHASLCYSTTVCTTDVALWQYSGPVDQHLILLRSVGYIYIYIYIYNIPGLVTLSIPYFLLSQSDDVCLIV